MTNFVILPKPDLIPRFLERCSEFLPSWEAHLASWKGDIGVYIDISALAHFLVDCRRDGRVEVVERAFGLVEEILAEGDLQARDLLLVGLIEDVQNISSHEPPGYVVFEPYLGERTMAGWRAVEQMWAGKSSLMDVVRAERRGKND